MRTISTEEPLARAVTRAIHDGNLTELGRLLGSHPGLAATRLGGEGPGDMSRTLLHVVTDWPGHYPSGPETVRLLVAGGADVDGRFHGTHEETALHWAASSDDVEVLDALLDAGADIEAPGAVLGGGPPLADARGFKQWRAAARLVERGAVVTLDDAATIGLLDRVRAVLDGPEPLEPQAVSRAFWGACHGGRLACARALLEHGADVDWVPPWEPLTPLDAARREGAGPLVAWLQSQGALSAADLSSRTADPS